MLQPTPITLPNIAFKRGSQIGESHYGQEEIRVSERPATVTLTISFPILVFPHLEDTITATTHCTYEHMNTNCHSNRIKTILSVPSFSFLELLFLRKLYNNNWGKESTVSIGFAVTQFYLKVFP